MVPLLERMAAAKLTSDELRSFYSGMCLSLPGSPRSPLPPPLFSQVPVLTRDLHPQPEHRSKKSMRAS